MVSRVTEITDREEVRDGDGNLLYVEFLVAVFDRDPLDPPAARVVSTEKVRIKPLASLPGQGQRRNVQHVDSITEEELDSYDSTAEDIEAVLTQGKTDVRDRADKRENNRKWPAELLSS